MTMMFDFDKQFETHCRLGEHDTDTDWLKPATDYLLPMAEEAGAGVIGPRKKRFKPMAKHSSRNIRNRQMCFL